MRNTKRADHREGVMTDELEKGYEVKPEHVKMYREEIEYWIGYFGLYGWEIVFTQRKSEDARAWCNANQLEDRQVEIGISTVWDIPPTRENISRVAFHEVCELWTMRFYALALTRNVTQAQLREENHNLIRTLENLLFPKEFKARERRKK